MNKGDKVILFSLILVISLAFGWLGWCLFGGPPAMICKDNKIFLKEMGYDIYRESPNARPCFESKELLK